MTNNQECCVFKRLNLNNISRISQGVRKGIIIPEKKIVREILSFAPAAICVAFLAKTIFTQGCCPGQADWLQPPEGRLYKK